MSIQVGCHCGWMAPMLVQSAGLGRFWWFVHNLAVHGRWAWPKS